MSDAKKQIALSRSEEQWLDEFAQGNEFYASVRAGYAEFGGLTPKQHEALKRDIERNSWKRTALRIDGVPVKNQYTTPDGRPRCGHRGRPWCQKEAVIVIAAFGYCAEHEAEGQDRLAAWQMAHADNGRNSGRWGPEIDGGGGSDE